VNRFFDNAACAAAGRARGAKAGKALQEIPFPLEGFPLCAFLQARPAAFIGRPVEATARKTAIKQFNIRPEDQSRLLIRPRRPEPKMRSLAKLPAGRRLANRSAVCLTFYLTMSEFGCRAEILRERVYATI
jgi:hypothetical protein